jgi:hypothetical protein
MHLNNRSQLTYCTNIHAGETWPDVKAGLEKFLPAVRDRVSPEAPFGVGLRLSALAARQLLQNSELQQFKNWLEQEKLYVFTLNGFPYGDFHHTRVKDKVHDPDWTRPERVAYTRDLIEILARLLPAGQEGSISTSPLSYRHWYNPSELKFVKQKSKANLMIILAELEEVESRTGKRISLCLEPEPDGVLENFEEFEAFFQDYLLAEDLPGPSREIVLRHCTLCYDICHFAVEFESHAQVLDRLSDSGIRVGKVQVSAALKADVQGSTQLEALQAFREPTYLHQVVIRSGENPLKKYPDLDLAIRQEEKNLSTGEWRVHFHVPVFLADYGVLSSTQEDIRIFFREMGKRDLSFPLEVETYTWEVLPDDLRLDLTASIARELKWVKETYETDCRP